MCNASVCGGGIFSISVFECIVETSWPNREQKFTGSAQFSITARLFQMFEITKFENN